MDTKKYDSTELKLIMNSVVGLPVEDWPEFGIKWDESAESLHYYGDGESRDFIEEHHPDGLIIADVNLKELDLNLVSISKQTVDEFWKIGRKEKKARLIAHWATGNVVTPCKISPYGSEIFIVGGNNRLAVSRIKNESEVPVLFDPKDLAKLNEIIQLKNIRKPRKRT
ncbi:MULTISPECIES: hypothetical protein [Vibrio]|uniref:hypothetical protein n=1 Tax=Vibrio TaxID=662 RepID=UPI000BA95EA2|nr:MULTISPECIES: hypothetical protein [Vibrio]PAR44993.1 hypothetical protein CGT95_17440 [Vibrio metoecus]TQQ11461.1 hypothetical protein FLL69_17175 [Vibrio cholerae]TQQ56200.1 hypothetical protein FLL63_18310 [Vibrio cholerae]